MNWSHCNSKHSITLSMHTFYLAFLHQLCRRSLLLILSYLQPQAKPQLWQGSMQSLFIIHPQVIANLKHVYWMERSIAVWKCLSCEPSWVSRGGRDRVLAWVLCQVPSVFHSRRGGPASVEFLTFEDSRALWSSSAQSYSCAFCENTVCHGIFFFLDLHKNKCFASSMHTMITLDQTEMRKVRSSLSGGKQMMSGWN